MKAIKKSKYLILKEYFIKEIKDILINTPFESIKDNVYLMEEFPLIDRPDSKQAYILIDFQQVSNEYNRYYNYNVTISYILNNIGQWGEVAGIEDYVDEEFTYRLKNQNKCGLWFSEPYKVSLDRTDVGVETQTVLTSSYQMKVYFK